MKVFDSLLYNNMPDLGLDKVYTIYDSWVFDEDQDRSTELPNRQKTVDRFRRAEELNQLCCIDIESWPYIGQKDAVLQESVDRMLEVISWAREEAPSLRIGWFARPMINFPPYVLDDSLADRLEQGKHFAEPIAREVDVYFPSIYPQMQSIDEWLVYADKVLATHPHDKPVIPFIRPHFTSRAGVDDGTPIPIWYWAAILAFFESRGLDIVLWGGFRQEWEENTFWGRVCSYGI